VENTAPSSQPVRNTIGWRQRLAHLQGLPVTFDLRGYDAAIDTVARLGDELQRQSDDEIARRAAVVRAHICDPHSPDDYLQPRREEFFALVREAASRTLGLRPFDEQILAALALHAGHIVEMQTGEGKTLVAVMPVALQALIGRGVHVLTFNDYLARRDAEWMAPVYRMLGLSVAFVQHDMPHAERRRAYQADVTYVTAKEAGFDHLRDLLATDPDRLVHRPFHAALVDEADSILIDEARVPLVIAGTVGRESSTAARLAAVVNTLTPHVHFSLDEYARNVELTDRGLEHVERVLGAGALHTDHNYRLLTELNCALHAHGLLRRDVDYIVRDGAIGVVDELTGRVVADRHWPDGLQAALEAKEGIARHVDGRILGSITLQHFLRRYEWLVGMTGTGRTAAAELREMYGLGVVVVPTHRPVIRVDHPDVVFAKRTAKEDAVVEMIQHAHARERPVLVGTASIEESERLAARLQDGHVDCAILNAKNDACEAAIVARAGWPGAVTISTNMAGRGTDIRLGGDDQAAHAQVAALGGLLVIATNRHESERIDLQLRGRAGRQGDPGESMFFVSLEDDLLVRYGIQALIGGRAGSISGHGPIDHPVLRREIARAQRIVEGQNVEIRRTLSRYALVLEAQRREVMDARQAILIGDEHPEVWIGAPELRRTLVAQVGEQVVRDLGRRVMLLAIDHAWREHLTLAADVREGIHLVGLGGQDPLSRYTSELTAAFRGLEAAIDANVLERLQAIRVVDGHIDFETLGLRGPSSTWTYLVNDDPFKNQIGMMLTGPGRTTIAIYAAAMMGPLLLLWTLVDRFWRRRRPS
jgi:preprotein translocase subunit SecA